MRWGLSPVWSSHQRCRSRGYQRSGLCRVGGKPVLENQLKLASPVRETITLRSFLNFYIPLAMTSLLTLLVQPIGSGAALSCMPQAPLAGRLAGCNRADFHVPQRRDGI